jgi:tetratricopeptide (TPR) repeat protein
VWVQRAKAEPDPQQRKFFFTNAVGDLSYFTARVPPESGIMAKALYSLAEAYNGLGDRTTAMQTLTEAVESHPENPATHVALGLFLRNDKDLAGARKALEHGVQVIGDSVSAELDYDLALVLLESDQKEQAVKYAHKAYELGYPLPGLRMKLARMGLWSPDVAQK